VKITQDGPEIAAGDEIVTYVARSLEPYRGFRTFMRSLPAILAARPKARVLIVGGDGVSYGAPPTGPLNYREQMLQELGDSLDLSRVHFLGKVSYEAFIRLLQVSRVHVYLTYPFVLSWSMLEAMSAGCLVVGSRTPPVEEVIQHGANGLLVDFFSPAEVAQRVVEALEDRAPDDPRSIRPPHGVPAGAPAPAVDDLRLDRVADHASRRQRSTRVIARRRIVSRACR
jgi:glycosyltransferase involved in cell wall biosynthesis